MRYAFRIGPHALCIRFCCFVQPARTAVKLACRVVELGQSTHQFFHIFNAGKVVLIHDARHADEHPPIEVEVLHRGLDGKCIADLFVVLLQAEAFLQTGQQNAKHRNLAGLYRDFGVLCSNSGEAFVQRQHPYDGKRHIKLHLFPIHLICALQTVFCGDLNAHTAAFSGKILGGNLLPVQEVGKMHHKRQIFRVCRALIGNILARSGKRHRIARNSGRFICGDRLDVRKAGVIRNRLPLLIISKVYAGNHALDGSVCVRRNIYRFSAGGGGCIFLCICNAHCN